MDLKAPTRSVTHTALQFRAEIRCKAIKSTCIEHQTYINKTSKS
jgi:hypothetical protein